jgi:organic radical activating enzyme
MLGKNVQLPTMHTYGATIEVKEVFRTIQGEGPYAGSTAVFVRLAGCNLACSFCDTDFDGGDTRGVRDLLEEVLRLADEPRTPVGLVVLTGGEPLRQSVGFLVSVLTTSGFRVQVETSGSASALWVDSHGHDIMVPRACDFQLVVSPKTPKLHPDFCPGGRFARSILCWKYVVKAGELDEDGLPFGVARPTDHQPIFVQPMDEQSDERNRENLAACVASAMRHGHRLGIQLHKLVGLR